MVESQWTEIRARYRTSNSGHSQTKDPEVDVKFILYDGPDQRAEEVELNTPAIRFYFPELTDQEVEQIHQKIGDTWNGRKVYQEVNSLIIIFE